MNYCSLEEAWGLDYKKKQKKSKRERKSERMQQKISDTMDPQILIPQMADTRQTYRSTIPNYKQATGIDGYDSFTPEVGSPYQSRSDPVKRSNEIVEANNRVVEQTLGAKTPGPMIQPATVSGPPNQMIQISRGEYETLKNRYVEGFSNGSPTDDQFNQLLLFIFTGIFYLLMLDTMYQLGKKSY